MARNRPRSTAGKDISEFGFWVQEWDVSRDGMGEVLACSGNINIARAAFEAAIVERPGRLVVLLNGARILGSHPQGDERFYFNQRR